MQVQESYRPVVQVAVPGMGLEKGPGGSSLRLHGLTAIALAEVLCAPNRRWLVVAANGEHHRSV